MGWYDYFTDLSSSLTIGTAYAEERSNAGPTVQHGTSDMSTGGEVTSNGMGTAQQRGGATPKGGVSTSVPAAGTNEESSSEAEANKADKAKQDEKDAEKEAPAGHKPGDGGEGSGQAGPGAAGPYGGPLKAAEGEDDEEEAGGDDEEEEEEEDEPEDIKPKLEEECMRTQQCAPLKHHYDECSERVTQQHEQHGKAHEDCVEECTYSTNHFNSRLSD
ncbi:Cytochrome b-c1 complex subunit 6, mitochondrial [Friedmanniomyces endolithicus]|uniref:Cytochrome b-c1 complex subunit 6, mitochondrial n=1 Tax=Rachicladosporium monterosium TaxID=1507873 RepID=A0ABR0L8R0_9PEZI|nr:Cytochrome b-c1 complex subunit 6, mitochondrial [Friedmanniomyces endolithicus]KAK1086800.1 Cytochrome b-c1 complex subunit 6, mitochondrial [Friedmanniomyces endolithicus]KAK1813732.1 Cytochrome b-c1 complex subunit 6, mitochondrial [Friedmanniomyces endolithicus]KAK5145234.1 Cytochrome b-c1 complex subunit 6, mitochondrial [Rachicladosporium monterosium]